MEKIDNCIICGNDRFSDFLTVRDHFLSGREFTIVSCTRCGFRFVNPRPDAAEIGKYYKSEDYISHSNARKGVINKIYHIVRKHNHKRKASYIQQYTPVGSLLDIGCATGEFLNYMQERGWQTTGVEPDEKARNFAKNAYSLDVMSESELDQCSRRFDVITMWHVLEHVHNLGGRLNTLRQLLNDDGTLFIAVPNSNSADAQHYGELWAGYDVPRHIYHFTTETIKMLFGEYNFKLADIIPMKFDAYYISLLSEKYKSGSKHIVKALWNGTLSNCKARKNAGNYSSLIYVFRRAN